VKVGRTKSQRLDKERAFDGVFKCPFVLLLFWILLNDSK